MQIKLSSLEFGRPEPSRRWSNSQQKSLEVDPWEEFIASLEGRTIRAYRSQNESWLGKSYVTVRSLSPVADSLAGEVFHKNYLEYLAKCWADHLGAVISPDILWHALLCELAELVAEEPERHRRLFSDSDDKQTILSLGSYESPPLSMFVEHLSRLVPSDVGTFLPEFSTSDDKSRFAFHAAFCDLVSPYYCYEMLLCGIPAVRVLGTQEDWERAADNWSKIRELFDPQPETTQRQWFNDVGTTLDMIALNRDDAPFWGEMFRSESCGSGSQQELYGWWPEMICRKQPDFRLVENFSSHLSQVQIRCLSTEKDYVLKSGLFVSRFDGEFLIPDFGQATFEKLAEPEVVGEALA